MKLLTKIFTGIMCGVLLTNSALAVDDCSNSAYKQAHPERCKYASSTDNSLLYWGGGAIAIGGIVALVGMASGGGGGSSSGSNPSSASTQYVRTIMPTMIKRNSTAPDFTSADLSPIKLSKEYSKNADAYNDIQLAYSIARGYTGLGTKIAVFDTDLDIPLSHGAAVMATASGPIAPNAEVEHHTIAYNEKHFFSYEKIGNIIASTQNSNVYNHSWNQAISQSTPIIRTREDFFNNFKEGEIRTGAEHLLNSVKYIAQSQDAIFVWAAGNDSYEKKEKQSNGTYKIVEVKKESGVFSAMPIIAPELNGHFINVVAWDSDTRTLANYSNVCGATKNYCITAPGTIKMPNGMIRSGTSFAAPVVSAAIAVIREAWPYLDATQITDILFTTAADLGADRGLPGIDEIYGHGMLDLDAATRPVGDLTIAVSDNVTQPLQTATVSPTIAHNIESANPTMAFFDAYGRAYETKISDNISARNRGLGFERLRGDDARAKINMGSLEFGFYRSDMLNGTGFLATDGETTTSYVATNHSFNLGSMELFTRSQFGTAHPIASSESMISEFSNIYTASAAVGLRGDKWSFSVGVPETIVHGNMNLHTATGRRADGTMTFSDYRIDMASTPAIEYMANWRFLTAGFVDNPYGSNEFYIFTKTKINF